MNSINRHYSTHNNGEAYYKPIPVHGYGHSKTEITNRISMHCKFLPPSPSVRIFIADIIIIQDVQIDYFYYIAS